MFYNKLGKCSDSKSRNVNKVLRFKGEKIDSANYRINFMNRSRQFCLKGKQKSVPP